MIHPFLRLRIKHVYAPSEAADGARILVDRHWPRGMSKTCRGVEAWSKEVAPSDALRLWFRNAPTRWRKFRRRYFAELDAKPSQWRPLLDRARQGAVSLLFEEIDPKRNSAEALRQYLNKIARGEFRLFANGDDTGFLVLDRIHSALDVLFQRHQKALVTHRYAHAQELLDQFKAGLRAHMRHEEHWLLPLYDARQDRKNAPRGFGSEIFALEHKKMLNLLAGLKARMRGLVAGRTRSPREVIELLDEECTFKHLTQHHNAREHSILYPSLDRLVSQEERVKLLARCFAFPSAWSGSRGRK
ncbi:MAG: DUF488 family protein [Planctomycetes bacterium]|nr:DUF488 family protein [Planctomycetota bacterium]